MAEGKDYLGDKLRLVERAREDIYFRQLDQERLAEARRQQAEATPTSEELEAVRRVYRKILVPVDFSPDAKEALLHAASLSEHSGASLIVLHVVPRDAHRHATHQRLGGQVAASETLSEQEVESIPAEVIESTGHDLREQSYTALHEFIPPHLDTLPVELRVVIGHPVERIVETAVKEQVDVIVMGTHGHTGLRHAMIGSVAERVVRLAPCAVLTVKTATPHEASWLERFYEDFMFPTRPY